MSETRELPAGWYSNEDPSTGKTYYYKEDGTTQWNFPGDPAPGENAQSTPETSSTEKEATVATSEENTSSTSNQASNQQDTQPQGNGTIGQILTSYLLKVSLFPFIGPIQLVIYIIGYVLMFLMEIITGFASLGTYVVSQNIEGKYGLLQAYLIADAFIMAADIVVHLIIMFKPAKALLSSSKNLPSVTQLSFIPFSNASVLFPNDSFCKTLFLVRCMIFCGVRVFQFAWNIVGSVAVSCQLYVVCFFIYVITNENIYTGLMFFGELTVILNWCSFAVVVCYMVAAYLCKQVANSV